MVFTEIAPTIAFVNVALVNVALVPIRFVIVALLDMRTFVFVVDALEVEA